jgi:CheY-like chemotaxis protein
MFATDLRLALTILPLLVLTAIVIVAFSVLMEPRYCIVQGALDTLNIVLQENIAGVRLVKAFVRSEHEEARSAGLIPSTVCKPISRPAYLACAMYNSCNARHTQRELFWISGQPVMTTPLEKQVQIVLIDDDEVDVPYSLATFSNGSEAKTALAGRFGHELMRRPYLILLDLNMPRMNGIELLDWLRTQPHLRRSIVFAFTTSEAQQDCRAAYDRQVAGYLVKSHLGAGYIELVNMLDTYTQSILFPPAVLAS